MARFYIPTLTPLYTLHQAFLLCMTWLRSITESILQGLVFSLVPLYTGCELWLVCGLIFLSEDVLARQFGFSAFPLILIFNGLRCGVDIKFLPIPAFRIPYSKLD